MNPSMASRLLLLQVAFFTSILTIHGASAVTFTFWNNCDETVWPAMLTSGGRLPFPVTGFVLPPGGSIAVNGIPLTWSGRVWGRYRCSIHGTSGRFLCQSGDCGTGQVACNGQGGVPPATLAEFTLGADGQDFYDTSNVDGFNLPIEVAPEGKCLKTSCSANINLACPNELSVRANGSVIACKSACLAFNTDEYCCRGLYGSPSTCKPSGYSSFFKAQCPQAYSYAYDDKSSIFTCLSGPGYRITFCP